MSKKNILLGCFEYQLWHSYAAGSLPDAQALQMEEHLLTCPDCLDLYLGIVEERLTAEDAPGLGGNFTAKVLQAIEQEKIRVNSPTVKKEKEFYWNRKVNLLISYCAAASIAMFFWIGGYFDDLSGNLGKSVGYLHAGEAAQAETYPSQGLIQDGWTKKMLENERLSLFEYFNQKASQR